MRVRWRETTVNGVPAAAYAAGLRRRRRKFWHRHARHLPPFQQRNESIRRKATAIIGPSFGLPRPIAESAFDGVPPPCAE
jgi:hypothetical protein